MNTKHYESILPESDLYKTFRFNGSERHEVFFGKNRKKSIEDGLIVYLTPEQHRGTDGVHGRNGNNFNLQLKKIAETSWCDYYEKSKEDFIKRYGKSYN